MSWAFVRRLERHAWLWFAFVYLGVACLLLNSCKPGAPPKDVVITKGEIMAIMRDLGYKGPYLIGTFYYRTVTPEWMRTMHPGTGVLKPDCLDYARATWDASQRLRSDSGESPAVGLAFGYNYHTDSMGKHAWTPFITPDRELWFYDLTRAGHMRRAEPSDMDWSVQAIVW